MGVVHSEPTINENGSLELRIYEIVAKVYPEDCGNITGMLLQIDENELKALLEDREELNERIHAAARVAKQHNIGPSVSTHTMNMFGNKVYGTVQQLYPVFAKKITGMILELGEERLVELLSSKDQFIQHIHKAARVAMDTEVTRNASSQTRLSGPFTKAPTSADNQEHDHQDETKGHHNILKSVTVEENEKEQLGGQLYLKVVDKYPNTASKITGMLLEMDIGSLHKINNDNDLLIERIEQAVQALEEKPYEKDDGHTGASNQHEELVKKSLTVMKGINLANLREQLDGLEEDFQKELIGEELYKTVFNVYPNFAAQITGMMLEMNSRDLLETLANTDLLQNRTEQAIEALIASGKVHTKNIKYNPT